MIAPWTGPEPASLLDAALDYATRGWSIIPTIGKAAAGRWKRFQDRRADEATLRRLFARAGVTGLAVVLGRVSGGLAVRDFDRESAYRAWADAYPSDAGTLPTVRTVRGFHVYGRLDAEQYDTLDDGELRADSGHYVLLPPSRHPDGPAYAWVNPLSASGPLPVLPPSLAQSYGQTQPTHADSQRPRQTQQTHPPIAWWTSAVADTLPSGPGQRNRCVFDLARRLKAARPDATPAELREVVREWHRRALPAIRTKDFGETWTDFAIAWERVCRPAGRSLALAAAAAAAGDLPAALGQRGYDGALRRLVSLCWQLHRQWGDQPFPLGCAKAGEHIGVCKRQAARLFKTLEFDGVLRRERLGTKASGKASEWRFIDPAGGVSGP
jgi:hypothetical protein